MANKRCPVTRDEFNELAEAVTIVINGNEMTAEPKQFSTGSFGWYLNAKTNVKIGERSVPVQIGMNLTVVGSKEAE